MKQFDDAERDLTETRKIVDQQQEEIAELYDLQDHLEQYTRKNSLEIRGIPEEVYETTEEVVLKLANALNVPVNPQDIEISHKLGRKGAKPIVEKFVSHKVKTNLYKARTKLKNVSFSSLFPASTAATRVASGKIYLFENLTSYRKKIVNRANEMRNDGSILSVWTMDDKYIFHCYFSFAFFLQFVAFRCRYALIAASDWLVLPILDAVFSLFSLSRLRS